jgi:hypothetical protein
MTTNPELKPLLVSVRQARELLGGCGNNRFWSLVKAGEFELIGTERKRWVVVESLNAYVERERAAAKAASPKHLHPEAHTSAGGAGDA